MLTPEAARERLEAQKVKGWKARRTRRLATLGPRASLAATAVLKDDPYRWSGRRQESGQALERLSSRQRSAVFNAFMPNLGTHAERMWTAGTGRPYQSGWVRRAFRAPNDPEVTLPARRDVFLRLASALEGFEPDPVWVARWGPLTTWNDVVSPFLAAVIDGGGGDAEQVFDVLVASAEGTDEVAPMGRHVPASLLMAERREGWEFVERLLLAAQREEGLRQAVLEGADVAHPDAFRRLVGVILENGLTRFSATVRAIDVWLGFAEGAGDRRRLDQLLERLVTFLDDEAGRARAIASGEAEDAYLALWSSAFEDAPATVPIAAPLLMEDDVERRWVAAFLLAQLDLTTAASALAPALDDSDLRVAAIASAGTAISADDALPPDMFERLERLLARLDTAKTELEPIVWPWTNDRLDRGAVAGRLPHALGKRPATRLVTHLKAMDPEERADVADLFGRSAGSSGEVRSTLLALVGDPSAQVRERAIRAARKLEVDDDEAGELEALLRRKAGDLRRGLIALLLARGTKNAFASADRLLAAKSVEERLGGLELLRRLSEEEGESPHANETAAHYQREHENLTEAEQVQLDAILGAGAGLGTPAIVSREDYFGLRPSTHETQPRSPDDHAVALATTASIRVLEELDALIHEHRNEEILVQQWWGSSERLLLGDADWRFPRVLRISDGEQGMSEADDLPLREVWERWAEGRAQESRDADGHELLRASVLPLPSRSPHQPDESKTAGARVLLGRQKPPDLRYGHIAQAVGEWLAYLHPPEDAVSFLLDAAETLLAKMSSSDFADKDVSKELGWLRSSYPAQELTEDELEERYGYMSPTWREEGWLLYLEAARTFSLLRPELWGGEDYRRFWSLERWVELPPERAEAASGVAGRLGLKRKKPLRADVPPLESLLVSYRAGAASDGDVVAYLLAPGDRRSRLHALQRVSGRQAHPLVRNNEGFATVVGRIRARIVELELARGETPSSASEAALELRWSGGLEVLVDAIRALGRETLVRGWTYDGEARRTVLSRIIRATYPTDSDTYEAFARAVEPLELKDARLVELATYAPQWSRHVGHTLGWEGLADGIWWMHAHTKDTSWTVADEIRESWAAEVAERTPLSSEELLDGAVDVAWFQRAYASLGEERWSVLDKAAKYCSSGGGHKRGQLFADAMRGAIKESALRARIADKRHQDSVRALGLLPLPKPVAARKRVVLERYELMQEFVRSSRRFGSQRQASEKRAVEIGLANLARTAGYPDPVRLSWAMEANAVADLAEGPAEVGVGDVVVALAINEEGQPEVTVRRGERVLKSVPAKARGAAEVKELRARATGLRRQASRMRGSLEQAMVRGDTFTGEELHELMQHPLLAPRLGRLLVMAEDVTGYPAATGRVLIDFAGERHAVGKREDVRLSHPVDLLAGGAWEAWQRDCLAQERVQPFKQIFRELYVPTSAEVDDGDVSRRYAGHQLQPRKALALLGSRGWISHPEAGVRRTFHDEALTVALGFLNAWGSPAEVEAPTLEEVRFYARDDWTPISIATVPARLFSEVMRDLDLVVSVAHAGGVDPEATASTIEMRSALVSETCDLLEIDNVRVEDRWVLVDGQLGEYSVHLGSAVVHRRPGGSVCIVPVHGQHRGRVFLPFADDDPKTAEVMAKVLLLAKDHEIKDPTILEQIRA